jgi:hypothetical protein
VGPGGPMRAHIRAPRCAAAHGPNRMWGPTHRVDDGPQDPKGVQWRARCGGTGLSRDVGRGVHTKNVKTIYNIYIYIIGIGLSRDVGLARDAGPASGCAPGCRFVPYAGVCGKRHVPCCFFGAEFLRATPMGISPGRRCGLKKSSVGCNYAASCPAGRRTWTRRPP